MKIAFVSPYSWTTPGGANNQIAGLTAALRARGHDVVVLAPADGPVPDGVVALGRTLGVPFNGSVARVSFGPRVAARVRTALRRERPDVVHVHEPFAPSASLLAVILARAPVVATFHAQLESRLYRVAGIGLRPLWRRLAATIAVSDAARATVERVFGDGVRVIPNAIDAARDRDLPPPDAARATVLFYGRLEPRKGPQVLVAAVPALRAASPGARTVIAGEGPLRGELERALAPEDRAVVSFVGAFDDAHRSALLADATVACFPALGGESFGVVLLEAMSAGRPVVASRIPGFEAVCRDGIDGRLVPAGDPAALAAALAEALRDPEALARASAAARARAAEFDWSRVVERVEEVYREVLDEARGAR